MMTVDEIANFDMIGGLSPDMSLTGIRAPRLITVVYEMRTESLRVLCEVCERYSLS
jgi:hypothetical protein